MNRLPRGLVLLLSLGLLLGACGIKGAPRPPEPPPPPSSETQAPEPPQRGPLEPSGSGPQDAGK
jgi:hypothetical protein